MNEDKVALLDVRNLKKYFPIYAGLLRHQVGTVKAVDGITFTLQPGEILGLVGESGCGKSTAARTSIRLIDPTEGSIHFNGQDITSMGKDALKELRKKVQMVFQDPYASLNPRRTIAESVGEALVYHGIVSSKEELENRIEQTLNLVGLSADAMDRYPHEFSGGQQQRICIGRAIAMNPRMIVCDEAVSALDVSVQAQILNLLVRLKSELGLSYLFITHDLSIVRHLCDRVVVMYFGKVVEEGATLPLFENPQHPYTKALLSAIPVRHPRDRI